MARRRDKEKRKADASARPPGPARVLVVHDDADGCELLVRILGVAGHDVARAHDFLEMSRLLSEGEAPECVVLDVNTEGIGGNLRLLDAIRHNGRPEVATARVVLVATNASSAVFSWQAGIDEFLARPFHADDFIAAVADALARPEADRRIHRRQRVLDATTSRRGGPTIAEEVEPGTR